MENITAKVSCFARAYHYKNSTSPIFADTAAETLLGQDYDRIAESMTQGVGFFLPGFNGSPEEGLRLIVDRQLSPSVLGRSAYCERMLENEIRLGCRQYVIFASGYDTFAIRNSNAALSVYEIDLPEVLADKQRRIEKAGLESRVVYVPCDLSETSWKDQLTDSGFRRDQKSFGSLLGISYYLGKDEFRSLLEMLGGTMSEGSAICFDYQSREESPETATNQALAQGAGEQMKAQYDAQEMEALLEECGFLVYEHLDHTEMTNQYFSDYNHRNPEHSMKAPMGVCYVLAVRKK
jgi:methyltransferase (TIGR00027 family)